MSSLEVPIREQIQPGESVLFFPSYAHPLPNASGWRAPIHGVVLNRTRFSRNRSAILSFIRRYLARDLTDSQRHLFDERSLLFRVACIPGRTLKVQFGSVESVLERTSRHGYFRGNVDASCSANAANTWVDIGLGAKNVPHQLGRAQLLAARGLSVISDIDDTIKVTEVWSRRRMLENTFLRPFAAVPGMPSLYRGWQDQGAAFHYVSASPWQLSESLWDFLQSVGFPAGSMHLKLARPRGLPWWNFLARGARGKWPSLVQILEAFPEREFILVGDTTSHDPSLYAECQRRFPDRIRRIVLREIPQGKWSSEGLERVFRDVPRNRWTLLRNSQDMAAIAEL